MWQGRVRLGDATPGRSTLSDPYRNFLKAAAQLVRAHAAQTESVPLLVTLGPPWQDKDMYCQWQASTWEERNVRWECPTGLGLLPLDQLFAICCRLHEHLGMVDAQGEQSHRFVILHSHTCSQTSAQLSTFIAVCHLLYSCGFESVNDALEALKPISPNHQTKKLLQGQRRYCDYVNCILHMDYLPPESDKSVLLKHLTFKKLSAFAQMKFGGPTAGPLGRRISSRRRAAHTTTSDGSEASTPREGSLPSSRSQTPTPSLQYDWDQSASYELNPDRILLSVICRGVEVWAGGVAPGSVDEEEDVVCFDFTRRGGGEGLTLLGDFVLALWFDDHKSKYDKPAIAYADHTAFLGHSSNDSFSEISRQITARQLDVVNQSYADYADKEGFFMEVTFRRGESPGEGPALGPCMGLHVPTVRTERTEVISRFGMIRCESEDDEESERRQPSSRAVMRQLRRQQQNQGTPSHGLQPTNGQVKMPEDYSPTVSNSGNLSFGDVGGTYPMFLQASEVELTPLGSSRSSDHGSVSTPPATCANFSKEGEVEPNEDGIVDGQNHTNQQPKKSPGSVVGKKKGLPPPPPPPLPPGSASPVAFNSDSLGPGEGHADQQPKKSPGSVVGKKKG